MEFFETMFTSAGMVSLLTLILLEIVLGIDNIIFIAIICGYLPVEQQRKARVIGLLLALVFRVLLLLTISYIARMTKPVFSIGEFGISGRDMILFAGGLFLIIKTIKEIIEKFKQANERHEIKGKRYTLMGAIVQIILIDIIFSFDSILTAVGLSNDIPTMITAVTVAMIVMILFAPYVSDFINNYPTIKMLALVFLVVIGAILVIEALHIHVDKSYIYVAMGFSLLVEWLNIRLRKAVERGKGEG
ncbi:MAG TPA: TerC family protein [Bacteroidia bacterium]|nr:TerC family protein [Bacteroidia bacterium]HNT79956.1 TerC family protein [Bacteroidia bacterium]